MAKEPPGWLDDLLRWAAELAPQIDDAAEDGDWEREIVCPDCGNLVAWAKAPNGHRACRCRPLQRSTDGPRYETTQPPRLPDARRGERIQAKTMNFFDIPIRTHPQIPRCDFCGGKRTFVMLNTDENGDNMIGCLDCQGVTVTSWRPADELIQESEK